MNFKINVSVTEKELEILKIFVEKQEYDKLSFSNDDWEIINRLFFKLRLIEFDNIMEYYQLSEYGKQIINQL